MRKLKSLHTADELARMSAEAVQRLLAHPAIHEARTVMAYASLPDEVDTHALIERLTDMGKRVVLPRVTDDRNMELRIYTSPADMTEGAYHIMEPTGALFTAYDEIDAAIIPAMAFDHEGHRLGRGRGYYDRFLAESGLSTATLIGLCFPFQLIDSVPCEPHDIKVDCVVARLKK